MSKVGILLAAVLCGMCCSAAPALARTTVYLATPAMASAAVSDDDARTLVGLVIRGLKERPSFLVLGLDDLMLAASLKGEAVLGSDPCAMPKEDACASMVRQWQVDLLLLPRFKGERLTVALVDARTIKTLALLARDLAPKPDLPALARSLADGVQDSWLAAVNHDRTLRKAAWREESAARKNLEAPRLRYTWIPAGVTLAVTVAAALVGAQADSKAEAYRKAVQASKTETASAATVMALKDQADDHALAANVLWGVAGAAALTTVAVFCWEYFGTPTAPGETPRLVVAPVIGDSAAAVSVGGRF